MHLDTWPSHFQVRQFISDYRRRKYACLGLQNNSCWYLWFRNCVGTLTLTFQYPATPIYISKHNTDALTTLHISFTAFVSHSQLSRQWVYYVPKGKTFNPSLLSVNTTYKSTVIKKLEMICIDNHVYNSKKTLSFSTISV